MTTAPAPMPECFKCGGLNGLHQAWCLNKPNTPPDITAVREALEKAIGDILYLANERNEIDRFKGTTDECGAAITILNRVDGGENG